MVDIFNNNLNLSEQTFKWNENKVKFEPAVVAERSKP